MISLPNPRCYYVDETKEQDIRASIIPQLESLASKLWDDGNPPDGRRLDRIIKELTTILDSENNGTNPSTT